MFAAGLPSSTINGRFCRAKDTLAGATGPPVQLITSTLPLV